MKLDLARGKSKFPIYTQFCSHHELGILLQRNLQINTYSNSREDHMTFEDYNPGQNSGDTKAIAYQIEASSLPPGAVLMLCIQVLNSTQSTLLGGERDSRNSPL